jgi:hypothetical protein
MRKIVRNKIPQSLDDVFNPSEGLTKPLARESAARKAIGGGSRATTDLVGVFC